MNLSGNMKKLRGENHLTQEQLAKILQVSRSTISSWETGRSYPDLEMVIRICDHFKISLDLLLREDEKMVRKLNFGIKQKRILLGLVIIFAILLLNTIVSLETFKAIPSDLEISDVRMTRDASYNGDDPYRDWNTIIDLEMKSKNIFFQPVADDLLVFNDNGNLTVQTNWSFNLFHIFNTQRWVKADQSVLLDEDISDKKIILRIRGDHSNQSIPFKIFKIND